MEGSTTWKTAAALLGAIFFCFPGRVGAALRGPCAKDIKLYCGELRNGVPQCLRDHPDRISKSCRLWVVRYDSEKKSAKAHCMKTIKKLCPDAEGWEEVSLCLQKHKPSEAPPICVKLYSQLSQSRAVVTGSGGPKAPSR